MRIWVLGFAALIFALSVGLCTGGEIRDDSSAYKAAIKNGLTVCVESEPGCAACLALKAQLDRAGIDYLVMKPLGQTMPVTRVYSRADGTWRETVIRGNDFPAVVAAMLKHYRATGDGRRTTDGSKTQDPRPKTK